MSSAPVTWATAGDLTERTAGVRPGGVTTTASPIAIVFEEPSSMALSP